MSVLEAPTLSALNSVAVSTEDLKSAWRGEVSHRSLPEAAALDARVAALRAWSMTGGSVDGPSVMEAASLAFLVPSPEGPRFDTQRFADLVEFLDHLPW